MSDVVFDKSIIISNKEGLSQTPFGTAGQLRFNKSSLKFEGYHSYPNSNTGADIFNRNWRALTQDVATATELGIIRVGTNLNIQASTGILASVAKGVSRIAQCVITVSPIVGAADYQSINEAISHAIGTPTYNPPYTDGFLTSNIGGTGIASPPSPLYPFVIQLGPGKYSESSNRIILPDYVSLRGEDNYNSVIIQNGGSTIFSIEETSMIITGQNSEIKNVVIDLVDSNISHYANAIYSNNKSNVVIDNCIITCSNTITMQSINFYIYGIVMFFGNNNRIINNKINFYSSTLSGVLEAIKISGNTTEISNNSIEIVTPNTTITYGITLFNSVGTDSIDNKVYIDNLKLSINANNTSNSSYINTGIVIYNTPLILKNSYIEVSNNPKLTENYGITFIQPLGLESQPYYGIVINNIISFDRSNSINSINSSNISIVNFLTLNYERGQYISVYGSSLNDGVYKIASVPTSNVIVLENQYNIVTETATLENTITLKGLYDINIYNTKIIGSTNSIKNSGNQDNCIFNLNNVVTEGGPYVITPSYTLYTNYKTITVGKANCDFTSLYNAMNSITDSSSITRYLIKIQSGIYYETTYIVCKHYVDIEGNGKHNTILKFSQSAETSNIPTLDTSCLVICSNMSIRDLSILNTNSNYVRNQTQTTTTILWNLSPSDNITLENIIINGTSNSVYNKGIFFSYASNIKLNNVDIILNTSLITIYDNNGMPINNVSINNIAIYNVFISECTMNNIKTSVNNYKSDDNYSLYLIDSECNIYNPTIITNSGINNNFGIYTSSNNSTQKLIQIYNGQIRAYNGVDYSIYVDNNYTIVCSGVQVLGETFTNFVASRLYCNGCYTFLNENDENNIQSLNSRGQNEQSLIGYRTITIGDTAGRRNATGTDNVLIGVNSGNDVYTASYNTFLGSYSGSVVNYGNNNTLLGSYAGSSLRYGEKNTVTGSNAAVSLLGGYHNVMSGYNSGYSLVNGNNNVFIGTSSGKNIITGNVNVFIGESTGLNTTIAHNNTFIGGFSGLNNEIGENNTYLGFNTGNNNLFGSNNVLVGNEAGYTNLTSNIVAIGNQAGYMNTDSIKNTYIGHNSGYNTTTGVCNTFLGYYSGYSNTAASSSYNIAIGNEAGYSLETAVRNVLIGSTKSENGMSNDAAGWSLKDGTDNIHIGTNSGSQATSTINNVLIGSDVGTSLITSSNNVLIGKDTGNSNTYNGGNIIIGSSSGDSTTTGDALIIGQNSGIGTTGQYVYALGNNSGNYFQGDYNMFLGYNSGGYQAITTKSGNYNLAIGPYSGYFLTSGSRNVLIGSGDEILGVGSVISSGSDNTLLGYSTGGQLRTGSYNTLIGSNAGANITSGINNLILGYSSAFNLNNGSNNVSLGPYSGFSLEGGIGNIYTGFEAGYSTRDGQYNINIGYQTGYSGSSITYENNIHIGYQSGYSSTASNNLFLGYQAGSKNTTGANNICIGLNSGQGENSNNRQIGDNNVFIGTNTGQTNDNGNYNIFLGNQAGKYNTDGSRNIFIGENTGLNSVLSHNIFIGTSTDPTKGIGYNSTINQNTLSGGNKNLFVGHDVGIENTSGTGNIFLGDSAGQNNTTGSQNIYLGTYAGNLSDTTTYNIAIGYNAGLSNTIGSDNILIGKNAGKFVNESNQIFIGSQAGSSTTSGYNNILIGYSAGASIVTEYNNVIVGYDAMSTGRAIGCVIIGNEAGVSNNGDDNVFIGNVSGLNNGTGFNNTFIGSGTGVNNDIGTGNIFMGTGSGIRNTIGSNNVCMGYNSGHFNVNGTENIFMGYGSGFFNEEGRDNICIGLSSGYNNHSSYNTFIGYLTGYNNDRTDNGNLDNNNYNTYIGNLVGQLNNGYNNFFLGYEKVNDVDNGFLLTTYHDKFAIYNNSQSGITSNTSGTCKILLGGDFTSGRLGVGTLVPEAWLTANLSIYTDTKLVVLGKCRAQAHTTFTGAHNVTILDTIDTKIMVKGMIMSSSGNTIKSGISDTIVTVKPSNSINDKKVFGVFSGTESVTHNNVTSTIYYVNSIGEGCILISNYGGEIQNGDYITTCPIGDGGYGSLQTDDIMHSYTVAKCTEDIVWSSITETISYNGNIYKIYLASCTYHC